MKDDLSYLLPTETSTEPTDEVWQACQSASYPITFEWPGGERTTYTTPEDAYADLWARSVTREVLALGGVIPSEGYKNFNPN